MSYSTEVVKNISVMSCPSNGGKKQFAFYPYFVSVWCSCINVVSIFPKYTFTSKQLLSFSKGENVIASSNRKADCLRSNFSLPPEKHIFVLGRWKLLFGERQF